MHETRDQNLEEVAESQTMLREAIEQNGRLIRENERRIDQHRRYWRRREGSEQA